MFRKMPFILLAIMVSIVLLNPLIPEAAKQVLYALSLTIKSGIMFILPFIIFGLLFSTMVDLAHRATGIILLILVCVCSSNYLSTFLSHYVGSFIYHLDFSLVSPEKLSGLNPAWDWTLAPLVPNSYALGGGIILGIISALIQPKAAKAIAVKLEWLVEKMLSSFTILIPLFVTGFMIKLQADGMINVIIKDYTLVFLLIALAQFSYITMAYFILNNGKLNAFLTSLKNMLPAAISGFSTMSSAASMPLTMIGVENNTSNKDLARSVIPVTVNIHLIGDCFAIPIFAYAVMKSFGIAEPDLITYAIFAFYFMLAKFSVAAVPGGGIIVMLPILEAYLGFNTPMMSLITALYVLFDPIITCANVLGNGAFAKMIDRITSARYRYADKLITG